MQKRDRLYSLDALRGLAALAIVFWHWQHMFFNPALGRVVYDRAAQPFYHAFYYLYNFGDRAVTIFFVLSGFVFYWLYSEALRGGSVRAREFVGLRISRLFPLHWATFALVVALQAIYTSRIHCLFVYPRHDWFLAGQTLLGVSSWIPHNIYGFNGPFWSVSIELLLYLFFLLICRFLSTSIWPALVMVFLGLALRHAHGGLGQGLQGFFMGGLAYHAFCWVRTRERALAWLAATGLATLAGWGCLSLLASALHLDEYPLEPVFAGIIVFIALAERRFPGLRTGLSRLGDISYSVYLLHFPLQLVFVLVNLGFGGDSAVFNRGWTLVLFMATLIPLGFLSYRYFELPALRFLRARLERPKAPAPALLPVVPAVPS